MSSSTRNSWLRSFNAVCVSACFIVGSLSQESYAAEASDELPHTAVRIIVQRSTAAPDQTFTASLVRETNARSVRMGARIGKLQVVEIDTSTSTADVLAQLRSRADIDFATIDRRKHRHALPNDALFAGQWYLQNAQTAAIDAAAAWDTSIGSAGTVVAVLDTGVRFDHPDLARAEQAGKLLPGFDFISADGGQGGNQFLTANDGNGWDADPTDPGDWIDSNDRAKSFFSQCDIENSSWHGTRVAGLIAAASNNSVGIAGASWRALILPVRVLGKCGGYDSDILQAMRWAAGLAVPGAPTNPYPAKILNLSFGGEEACSAAYQTVIQELSALGVLIVASAGNSGGPVNSPANCPGVVAVAGLRHAGSKVGYSSLGPEIALAAPAGNCVNTTGPCLFSLDTTVDLGRTLASGPGYTDQINTNLGTSFSAPLVSGVAALMHSVNAKLDAHLLKARLMEGVRPFPTTTQTLPAPPTCHVPTSFNDLQPAECICTTSTCGAGMLHAPSALIAARRPIVSIVAPAPVNGGSSLQISGANSSVACNRSLSSYSWSVVSFQGTSSPTLSNSNEAIVQVNAPTSGSFTLRLTVTDDQGASDSGEVTVTSNSAVANTSTPLTVAACPSDLVIAQTPPPAPTPTSPTPPTAIAPTSQKSGGGGSTAPILVLALFVLALYRVKPSSSCRNS